MRVLFVWFWLFVGKYFSSIFMILVSQINEAAEWIANEPIVRDLEVNIQSYKTSF